MYILFSGLLILIVLLVNMRNDCKQLNTKCVIYIVFNIMCTIAIFYLVNKERESYIVRSNVKDISTFLL